MCVQDEIDNSMYLTIIPTEDFVYENTTLQEKSLNKQFNDFVNEINCYVPEKKTNKIKIYNINILRTDVAKEIPNPEYQDYVEKYGTPDAENDEKKHEKTYHYGDFPKKIPSKTFTKYESKSSVECTYITEKSKDFDTLYLREDDHGKLKGVLDSFKSKKALLESLGLPNKLGVLLYGLPGTGKTSCIWTIATYLQKDIYYVNLSTVETNKELQMIFNYVTENGFNSGILVFEDIDAMTDVVHSRIKKEHIPINFEKYNYQNLLSHNDIETKLSPEQYSMPQRLQYNDLYRNTNKIK
jgi:DNA replication protein DnaC